MQGVGFRHACRQEARFLGITGFVMNKPNGTVYIEAEGSPEQLNQFISWCNKGPGYGFTDNVQVESQPYKALNGFIIKY
ncbi:MAG: acylphosphatase [Spirochaetales bacterium]|nr:acylphosphatase [Spirochaetales bacterium]